jgi:aldose 1-epimerase
MVRWRKRARQTGVVLGVSAALAGGEGQAADARPVPYSAEVVQDAGTGWGIVVLRYQDERDPERNLEARIAPPAGGNLYSLQAGDDELLYQPPSLGELIEQRAGTPVLFPTPNRVRDGKMVFEGRSFQFPPNNQNNFIHGFARKRPWQTGPVQADGSSARAELSLAWDERQPDFAQFPIKHRLTVVYTLRRTGIRFEYRVDNLDTSRLPFGFGLHPYFRIPGDRSEVRIKVPLDKRMEAQEMLPTGELAAVEGTDYDLRRPRKLAELKLDDVYFGMAPGKPAWFELSQHGLRVELGGSKELTHLVVFTPPDRPFFCIENQTSSTDAHNLWAQGKKKASHLLIVPPKKSARGHVDWTIKRVPAPTSPVSGRARLPA